MKPKYLNNLIEDSYSLFTRMKSGIRKAGLVALVGAIIGVGVYGCKKEEPKKEDALPTASIEQIEKEPIREYTPPRVIVQEPQKEETLPKPVSLEDKLYKQTKIAFSSNRSGNFEIYVINPDGSEQTRLTNEPASDRYPSWSPDGKKIAFESRRDGNVEIYVMNSDGSNQTRLTFDGGRSPAWSPDGEKIAFEAMRVEDKINGKFNCEIYIMNADGSEQKRLTNNLANDKYPHWSPDGKKIAFLRRVSSGKIYVMNADGSGLKRLTKYLDTWADAPYWSPDGKKIAFTSHRDRNYEIYIINADGTKHENLTNNPANDRDPSWSPDGKKIAFRSKRDGNFEIYVMNADGGEQKRLTNNPDWDINPSWSPDGKKIAFDSGRFPSGLGRKSGGKPFEIYVMNVDGSEQKRLTNNRADDQFPSLDQFPSWSPFLPLENKTNENK